MTKQVTVAVEPDGRATIRLPLVPELRPGEHAGLLIIQDNEKSTAAPRLILSRYDVGLKTPGNLRREELYGDNGR